MGKKVISFGLSASEIDKAIGEINKYKQEFQRKVDLYRQKLAEEIANDSQMGFNSSIVDDIVHGSSRTASVSVTVSHSGDISVVVANGEDAVWCEFGAGVYHNGSVGSSPNPYGTELGLTIGSYGKGYGKANAWGYYDENGQLILTRGTPASMPMYNAVQSVTSKAVSIAREVFG